MPTKLTPPDQNPQRPELQPPAGGHIEPQKPNLRTILLVAFTLFALLDIAILAYIFLSNRNEIDTKPAQEQTQPAPAQPSPDTGNNSEGNPSPVPGGLIRAKEMQTQWLQQQAVAEADGIRSWAGTQYSAIISQAASGEQSLADEQYQVAEKNFQEATDALAALLAGRPEMVQQALQEGAKALRDTNSKRAAEAFTRALTLAPENPIAVAGLSRAQTLDQVLLLYTKGLDAEAGADLKKAETFFQQSKELDPEFLPASQALTRVLAARKTEAFHQAMGRFLQALAAANVPVAQKELSLAANLQPQSPAVTDGKKQLQQLVTQQTIAKLEQQYITYAGAEQWQQAAQTCKQILKIVPDSGFALAGLQKSTRRAALAETLQGILDQPERLQEQGPLEEARKNLARADAITDAGPKLQAQRIAVHRQIQIASRPIPLILQSDNNTEVSVYRVGRLGKFNQRELQLRPGRYTVVGSRPGYRDVRQVIEIKPDTQQAHLRIFCTEAI